MQIVLEQLFPLGRFHATPWRVNPFDDPYGEWPPSPWRLVRAIVARWYQWAREATPEPPSGELDELVHALCTSRYRFHLSASTRRGSPLRQYLPAEFGWNPEGKEKKKEKKKKKKAAFRTYGRSLGQDNYWCIAPTDAVWWFLDGEGWTTELIATLDHCLARICYFGRAEAFTRIRRAPAGYPAPNCALSEDWGAASVPVLVPSPDAKRADVERVTDDDENVKRSVPPGARVMYALRPPRPPAREISHAALLQADCRLVQLAICFNVAPELRAIVRLTSRFRGAVLRELLRIITGDSTATWSRAAIPVREAVAPMFGKDAFGSPLAGHRHAEFLVWCEDRIPTRLLVWRDGQPFDSGEQAAILCAAAHEVSWAAPGCDSEAWKVRLVPLDRAVPPPPGFDDKPARLWESITPYVPPRHHLRGGKLRAKEAIAEQVRRELAARGFPHGGEVEVRQLRAMWVAVHVPRREAPRRAFLGDRRGYLLHFSFPDPVRGPLRLGHSSSFGLGLFAPTPVPAMQPR